MSESLKPNVVASLFTIHKVITRALAVSIEKARTFSQRGFPDEATRRGFVDYVSALISVLHAHHLTEDDLAFPYFKDKLPDAPFDALTQQHREMVPVLGEIKRMVEAIEESSSLEGRLENLARALEKINERWHPHIQIEEEHFELGKVAELLPVVEQMRLTKLYGKYSQEHSGPAHLTVPFILFNLPVETRDTMAKGMPAEVVERLVPVVWRGKWESMKPFLLE
jgi:hemerythrin-like domain-containing protein